MTSPCTEQDSPRGNTAVPLVTTASDARQEERRRVLRVRTGVPWSSRPRVSAALDDILAYSTVGLALVPRGLYYRSDVGGLGLGRAAVQHAPIRRRLVRADGRAGSPMDREQVV